MVERPDLIPQHGQAVIKLHATGLGARDIRIIRSQLPADGIGVSNAPAPDRIPLQDSAGEVIAVGEGVTRVRIGDRVMATHYPKYIDGKWHVSMFNYDFGNILDGFLAEQAVVEAEALVKIPDSLSYEEASTLQSSGLTPWRGLVIEGRAQTGDTVLILGTGNVSIFGLQIAKTLGARVIITSSSDERLEKMRAMGADIMINYRTCPNWPEEVLRLTEGEGADIVLNTVGFPATAECLLSCASNGRVVWVGADPTPAVLTGLPNMIKKDLTLVGFTVGSRRMFEEFVRAIEINKIKPVIDRVFPFEHTLEAIEYYEKYAKIGKVVIKIQ
jgi:NADPH:quinone reductase-like Zn-dependent oxidoreductase